MMEGDHSQPTQQATQDILDPRRLGKQNSGFSDDDMADIVCLLVPSSPNACQETARLAREGSPFVMRLNEAAHADMDHLGDDAADHFGLLPGSGLALVLRLSAAVKDPMQGFTFGRNAGRSDVCFVNDSLRRLSNIHFRIFINEYGVLMLQDQSTNGTYVDDVLLKARRKDLPNMRTLSSASTISVLLHNNRHDLAFMVRVPRREGEYEHAYQRNLADYLRRLDRLTEAEAARVAEAVAEAAAAAAVPAAGPHLPLVAAAAAPGHVNLFPPRQPLPPARAANNMPPPRARTAASIVNDNLPREWNGSNRYNRIGPIGKGAFATVVKVTAKFDGRPYAAKELDKRRFIKNGVLDQKVENEMRIMQSVDHPNIVRYIEHIDVDERLLVIIMEYLPEGDLSSFVNRHGTLSEPAVQDMTCQLVDALGYLHSKNITHRDVKPDNILISSTAPFTVKLTDFGLSKMIDNDQTFLRTFCGTLLYCAPEVYSEYAEYDEDGFRNIRNRRTRRDANQSYNHSVDIWSLAGVLFFCLTRKPPYPTSAGMSHTELLHRIMTTPLDISPLVEAQVSPDGVEFLSMMLQRRPEHRATIAALQSHAWLADPDSVQQEEDEEEAAVAEQQALDLEQSASQLSLQDDNRAEAAALSDDDFVDDDDDLLDTASQLRGFLQLDFMDAEKENQAYHGHGGAALGTSEPQNPQRLFGEVNVSAIGSSGVIPEDRLNLPLSEFGSPENRPDSFAPYDVNESLDSSAETFHTPRQQQDQTDKSKSQLSQLASQPRSQPKSQPKSQPRSQPRSQPPAALANENGDADPGQSHSVNELNNMTFDVESQSLGGAESILENLNMKSLAASHFKPSITDFTSSKSKPITDFTSSKRKPITDFTSSKRKPTHDTSDEFDSNSPRSDKPTIKRLKSATHIDSFLSGSRDDGGALLNQQEDDDDDDPELYAAVQPISHSKAEMDLPVPKTVYWVVGQTSTWHLDYPEMTQLQYTMFEDATTARGEKFLPGQTKLWNLAMKHFPPTTTMAQQPPTLQPPLLQSRSTSRVPDTAAVPGSDRSPSIPSSPDDIGQSLTPQQQQQTKPPARTRSVFTDTAAPRVVATLTSTTESVVPNISVEITESVTSWGRCLDNTHVYTDKRELKVPKYAFKILVWRSSTGSEPWKELQPWERLHGAGEVARQYHFYISTKARGGILVHQTPISSVDPGHKETPSRHWVRLYDGDPVIVWHNGYPGQSSTQRTELVFRCQWGGSAEPRPLHLNNATPALEDDAASRRLDSACLRAERAVFEKATLQQCMARADVDVAERKGRLAEERQRSVVFEQKRADICARFFGQENGPSHGRPDSLLPSSAGLAAVAYRPRPASGLALSSAAATPPVIVNLSSSVGRVLPPVPTLATATATASGTPITHMRRP